MSLVVLLVGVLLSSARVSALPGPHFRASDDTSRCETGVPAPWVDRDGRAFFIENLTQADGPDGTVSVGFPMWSYAPVSGALQKLTGGVLTQPGGHEVILGDDGAPRQRIWPRVITADHVVHMVWGEDTSSHPDVLPHVTELWHSALVGRHWSRPSRILGPSEIRWDPNESSPLRKIDGGIAVAVPGVINRVPGVSILQWVHGRWHEAFAPFAGIPTFVDVSAESHDSLLVAWSSADPRAPGRTRNALFALSVARAAQGTLAGVTPQLIFARGMRAATMPRFVAEGREPALVFAVADTDRDEANWVYLTRRSPNGRWMLFDSLAAPAGVHVMRTTPPHDTPALLMIADGKPSQGLTLFRVGEALMRIGAWPSLRFSTAPTLYRHSNEAVMTWGNVAPGAVRGIPRDAPVTFRMHL